MKNKLKKHGVKILTMIICMVTILTALVIVPSADTYDDNCIHYWYYFNYTDRPIYNETYAGDSVALYYNSPTNQKLTFVYGKDSNGDNLFTYHLFKEVTIYFRNYDGMAQGSFHDEYQLFLFFDYDYITTGVMPSNNYACISYYWKYGEIYGITLEVVGVAGIPYASLLWEPSYGNYNLQLWLNPNALANIETRSASGSSSLTTRGLIDSMFRSTIISYPKTYTNGYSTGVDFGLEEGYNNGYDQGSIDGYQQGYTEGETIGYNEGYDNGYSDGNGDGYALGYDEGEAYGWANGFGAGQNDMAETSHTFKEMVFAIFDAPSRLIDSMLNFDIFGINLAGLVKTIITLAVVAVILVILLKWLL